MRVQPKPPCLSIYPWLKANLGNKCVGALTGTDHKALKAAVQLLALFAYDADESLIEAFAAVVRRMQPSTRYLAFHAIAHVMDWSDRARIWDAANLGDLPRSKCNHEPSPRPVADGVRQGGLP